MESKVCEQRDRKWSSIQQVFTTDCTAVTGPGAGVCLSKGDLGVRRWTWKEEDDWNALVGDNDGLDTEKMDVTI